MLKELIKVANKLDMIGLTKEADYIDQIVRAASNHQMLSGSELDEHGNALWDKPIIDEDGEMISYGPRGIGVGTAGSITDDTQMLIDRLHAVDKLAKMSDEDFEALKAKHPRAFEALFGKGSLTPVSR
jgi:hypothetical protein